MCVRNNMPVQTYPVKNSSQNKGYSMNTALYQSEIVVVVVIVAGLLVLTKITKIEPFCPFASLVETLQNCVA